MKRARLPLPAALALCFAAPPAQADNLYQGSSWAAMSTDRRAAAVGDALTIVIYQAAEAVNSAQNSSRRNTNVGGGLSIGSIDERADLDIGGSYTGRGEVRRSERLVAQITVVVQSVLANGDLIILGEQWMRINGERTRIAVRGRVRPADISSDNRILSSRIADAQIDYDGRGFVSRSARPGLINRIFSFLGLG